MGEGRVLIGCRQLSRGINVRLSFEPEPETTAVVPPAPRRLSTSLASASSPFLDGDQNSPGHITHRVGILLIYSHTKRTTSVLLSFEQNSAQVLTGRLNPADIAESIFTCPHRECM